MTGGLPAAGIAVRAATRADLDAIVEMRLALLREHADNPLYARLRPDVASRARRLFAAQLAGASEATFVAVAGAAGDTVGVLRCIEAAGSPLLLPERYAYVASVYVRPAWRRRGALRLLVAAAEGWARRRGLDELRLHSAAGHDASNAAWDALGFAVVELTRSRAVGR